MFRRSVAIATLSITLSLPAFSILSIVNIYPAYGKCTVFCPPPDKPGAPVNPRGGSGR